MQQNSNQIKFIIGNADTIDKMISLPALQIFDPLIIHYLDSVSRLLLSDQDAKQYPDVITFGFWCRKASVLGFKKQYEKELNRFGKGIVFHIAPSNVAVNFAYSFAAALLSGNANIVRIPSRDFNQVTIILNALQKALTDDILPYICMLQYGHDQKITDFLSSICDMRVIWGGDQTIMTIRNSLLKPSANEVTFSDRYSICIIDADKFIKEENKRNISIGFYNDTYLSDQNACTSPRIVIWMGQQIEEAQKLFWDELYTIVKEKYTLLPVNVVNKYTNLCKLAVFTDNIHRNEDIDNYIVRIKVDTLINNLMDYRGNCGFFFEYYARKMEEILPVCSSRCQTISYYGVEKEAIHNFLTTFKPRGVDRIVPIGKTMDFSLTWDGYDLINILSRKYYLS